MIATPALFRLLGDEVRLRLLRLLAVERLNVSELTAILGLAQSGVSRHLGLLKDAALITEEREAGFTYYRIAAAVRTPLDGFGPLWPLLETHFSTIAAAPAGRRTMPGSRSAAGAEREFRRACRAGYQGASAGAREEPGRRGPARWATSCRRCVSPIWAAARAI